MVEVTTVVLFWYDKRWEIVLLTFENLFFPWIDFYILVFVLPMRFQKWCFHMRSLLGAFAMPVHSFRVQPHEWLMAGSQWLYQYVVRVHLQSGVSKLILCPNSCTSWWVHWGSLTFTCSLSAHKDSTFKIWQQKTKLHKFADKWSLQNKIQS